MGQFIKYTLASCLGVILATLFLGVISFAIFSVIASMSQPKVSVSPNSVLKVSLNYPIPERTNNTPYRSFSLTTEEYPGLQKLVDAIHLAKDDNNIKGVVIDANVLGTGTATAEMLREALLDFKESGKPIWAYSGWFGQSGFYVASVADHIIANPMGGVDLRGFAAIIPFLKDLQDRSGIEFKTFYSGQFKSATEPFRRNDISDANRMQTREFLEDMYGNFINDVASARQMDPGRLRQIIDDFEVKTAEDALELGLVDEVGYEDDLLNAVRERLGLDQDDDIPVVELRKYATVKTRDRDYAAPDRIAVIYAEGEIVDHNEDPGIIAGDKYVKLIRDLRRRSSTKAIVLRVNSPGGSVLASDAIYRELKHTKEDGIPIVVSMGDYAASGGYYISCMADSIYASPTTLTGSIGVFMLTPHIKRFLDEKLGIQFDTVSTGQFAHGFTPVLDWSPEEEQYLQQMTDRYYDIFLGLVADGRNMSKDEVHRIAQGRVWTGTRAVEIGLVDRIGTLDDAIATAARLANLDRYRLSEYPAVKDPITRALEMMTGQQPSDPTLQVKKMLRRDYPELNALSTWIGMSGPQARMPYVISPAE